QAGVDYRSLADWRKTGAEQLDGKDVGSAGDPRVTGYGPGMIPADADQRISLSRYRLRPGSPAAGAGLDLKKRFGVEPGDRDFWGNLLRKGQPAAVGAHAGPAP